MDIKYLNEGYDLQIVNNDLYKCKNLLNVQVGSLYYALEFGIDMDFFMRNPINLSIETFKTYLINRIVNNNILFDKVIVDNIDKFILNIGIKVKDNDDFK